MKLLLKLRADTATDYACNILTSGTHNINNAISKQLKATTAAAVRNRINQQYIISQSGNIIVTHIGYVTMALLSGHAIYRKELLLIPGVDDKNQFGYLVLHSDYVPYHSLAQDIEGAVADTEAAQRRATELLDYFRGKKALKQAAQNAPWYQVSTIEDAVNAGMCEWGTLSFLNRAKIAFIVRHTGLPRFLVRHIGGYGNRITASTTRRLDKAQKAKQQSRMQPDKLHRKNT